MEKERKLKVYYWHRDLRRKYSIRVGRRVPRIILQGDWLREAGFDIADDITVCCKKGKLTIKKLLVNNKVLDK